MLKKIGCGISVEADVIVNTAISVSMIPQISLWIWQHFDFVLQLSCVKESVPYQRTTTKGRDSRFYAIIQLIEGSHKLVLAKLGNVVRLLVRKLQARSKLYSCNIQSRKALHAPASSSKALKHISFQGIACKFFF